MEILIHIGLNKCASTYVQHALDEARGALQAAGTCYPLQDGPPCQYGLSRGLGFGPEAPGIAVQTLDGLIADAAGRDCGRLILSSEYLSLWRPAAAKRLGAALATSGAHVQALMFSRDVPGWIRSLFNQYVRTVDGGRYLPCIDAFVDQVLSNGAADIARRHRQWSALLPPGALRHYRLPIEPAAALAPFSAFARVDIPPPRRPVPNASVAAGALYRIGRLRQQPPGPGRDAAIARLLAEPALAGDAPPGYLTIGADRMERLESEIIAPYRAIPVDVLPSRHACRAA